MSIIQWLLMGGLSCSLFLYLKYFRSTISDRLIGFLLFATAVGAVLVPQITTEIAHVLGVGRGTDLVFYLFILASVFGFILMKTRLIALEDALTEVIRQQAITEAEKGTSSGIEHRGNSVET